MLKRVGGEVIIVIIDSDFWFIFLFILEIRYGCLGLMIVFGYVSICSDGVFKKFNVIVEDCKYNVI